MYLNLVIFVFFLVELLFLFKNDLLSCILATLLVAKLSVRGLFSAHHLFCGL